MSEPRICILVLNWNGADDTIECLTSLKNLTYQNAEIVVIDNGSTDESVLRIREKYKGTKIIEIEQNLYFGGGNNAGLAWAQENNFDYVVFLNNDTTVEPDFIEPLLSGFAFTSNVGMVAPVMCYSANPDLIWYGGGVVNLWTGQIEHRNIRKQIDTLQTTSQVTEYISGCCLMMPTSLATDLGGFDLSFQMYGEDVDLSLRTRAAGHDLVFVPGSKIYHKVSASVGGEFAVNKLKRKFGGLLRIFATHAKWYQWFTIFICQIGFSFKYFGIYLRSKSHGGTN